ncbi:MAG: hypothetical protein AAFR66_15130 [Bacteroidota bacterium]
MREVKLDSLFAALQLAEEDHQQEKLENSIWEIWMDSGNAQVDKIMESGMIEMGLGNYTEAIKAFSKIIKMSPDYAEGWNKRATAYFLRGDFKASLKDIEETLSREKRHFGAISGRLSIQSLMGDNAGSLQSLRKLNKLLPYEEQLEREIQKLEEKLGIRRI